MVSTRRTGRVGRRIPDDPAVVVSDEAHTSTSIHLGIDTAIIPFREVGTQAAQLLGRLTDEGDDDAIAVPYVAVLSGPQPDKEKTP